VSHQEVTMQKASFSAAIVFTNRTKACRQATSLPYNRTMMIADNLRVESRRKNRAARFSGAVVMVIELHAVPHGTNSLKIRIRRLLKHARTCTLMRTPAYKSNYLQKRTFFGHANSNAFIVSTSTACPTSTGNHFTVTFTKTFIFLCLL
jgi:hypothetical protein